MSYYTSQIHGEYDSLYGMMNVSGEYRQCFVLQTNFVNDTLDLNSKKLRATIRYDSTGRKIEHIIHDAGCNQCESKDVYTYDNKKLKSIESYYIDLKTIVQKRIFEYDSLGYETRVTLINIDWQVLEDKRISYVRMENHVEKTVSGTKYDNGTKIITTDKFGNKISAVNKSSAADGREVYEYNDKHQLIKEIHYSSDTDIIGTHILKYDSSGSCIFESYATPIEYYIHKLSYDSTGNVTKIINLNSAGKPTFILEFEYSR